MSWFIFFFNAKDAKVAKDANFLARLGENTNVNSNPERYLYLLAILASSSVLRVEKKIKELRGLFFGFNAKDAKDAKGR